MRALPIVITAALLAGCAAQPTQTVWARLDGTKATQAQLAQDEAACRYEAAQLAYQRPERRGVGLKIAVLVVVLSLALAWGIGLVRYVGTIPVQSATPTATVDAKIGRAHV